MFEFLKDLTFTDYRNTYKIVLVVYILFGTLILKLLTGQTQRLIRNDKNILITFIIFLILFAGTRGKTMGVDTGNYYSFFYIPATQVSFFETFTLLKSDVLFELLLALTAWTKNFNALLILIAIVLNFSLYAFVRRFTDYGKEGSSLLLFLTLASSFSFVSLEINIMRNALALGFVLMSINYAIEGKLKKVLILLIIAFLFHRTTVILIVTITIVLMTKKTALKYYLIAYMAAIGLSIGGFGFHSISFLSTLGNEDLSSLSFSGDTAYKIGFRSDFVAFNTFFLILFLKFIDKKSEKNMFLIKYYIITSILFFFNFYIPFSDRFGLFSWLIIPLLLFNIVNEMFPKKKIFISTIVVFFYYLLNYVILFP